MWNEILVGDKTATPADLAASRIDFPAWLETLNRRDRKIAMKLAVGEKPGRVARMFHLSAAGSASCAANCRMRGTVFTGIRLYRPRSIR